MAGQLTIDTLRASTGVLATQNGMTGVAKAWVNFNGTGTVAINGSFNVSSITDNGTGDYTINFTTAMPNANYAPVLGFSTSTGVAFVVKSAGSSSAPTLMTTTQLQVSSNAAGAGIDGYMLAVTVFSS